MDHISLPPHTFSNASILERIKEGYLLWIRVIEHMARGQRYTIGQRIEKKFLDLLELTYHAYFTEREKKAERIAECVFILDTLKFILYVAWEGKLLSTAHYGQVAQKLDEVGKMFGGWQKSLDKPDKKNRTL